MWEETEDRKYPRTVQARELVLSFVGAFLFHCSSIQSVCGRYGKQLGTQCVSTISKALQKPSFLSFTRSLMKDIQAPYKRTSRLQVWALDSMPVTLPLTQRGKATKCNNRCKGGGVMWSINLDAPLDTSPIRILKVMRGSWNDCRQVRDVKLIPNGPLYVIDRGFYSMNTMIAWGEQLVRYIMRAKKQHLDYEVLETISKPRKLASGIRIELDARVIIRTKQSKQSVEVRLVKAWLDDGTDLFLVTTLYSASAEHILKCYRRRDRIEKFHQLLKDTIGLAHLYSFEDTGIELLIEIAAMTAILLYLASGGRQADEDTVRAIRRAFREIRRMLDLGTPWKRNTFTPTRKRAKPSNISKRRRLAMQ